MAQRGPLRQDDVCSRYCEYVIYGIAHNDTNTKIDTGTSWLSPILDAQFIHLGFDLQPRRCTAWMKGKRPNWERFKESLKLSDKELSEKEYVISFKHYRLEGEMPVNTPELLQKAIDSYNTSQRSPCKQYNYHRLVIVCTSEQFRYYKANESWDLSVPREYGYRKSLENRQGIDLFSATNHDTTMSHLQTPHNMVAETDSTTTPCEDACACRLLGITTIPRNMQKFHYGDSVSESAYYIYLGEDLVPQKCEEWFDGDGNGPDFKKFRMSLDLYHMDISCRKTGFVIVEFAKGGCVKMPINTKERLRKAVNTLEGPLSRPYDEANVHRVLVICTTEQYKWYEKYGWQDCVPREFYHGESYLKERRSEDDKKRPAATDPHVPQKRARIAPEEDHVTSASPMELDTAVDRETETVTNANKWLRLL